ncbi:thioredoxin family protein [Neisseria iguanae]|uniref:Thioredoxin n=1 Tax=Neisseria iguanae TaxID=90242 RepID=A0A2P7U1I3_9NEIS|nr:thioredoxin family protein [Neisseria iguanae]PSJ80842.1 thioredoxin [Neisseria iguanae]
MHTYPLAETLGHLANTRQILLYLSGVHCGVCHAIRPSVQILVETHKLTALEINLTEQAEAAAAFEVLTIPAVLLYAHGREYHRQAKFIDLKKLEKQIEYPPLENTDYAEIFK